MNYTLEIMGLNLKKSTPTAHILYKCKDHEVEPYHLFNVGLEVSVVQSFAKGDITKEEFSAHIEGQAEKSCSLAVGAWDMEILIKDLDTDGLMNTPKKKVFDRKPHITHSVNANNKPAAKKAGEV